MEQPVDLELAKRLKEEGYSIFFPCNQDIASPNGGAEYIKSSYLLWFIFLPFLVFFKPLGENGKSRSCQKYSHGFEYPSSVVIKLGDSENVV